MKDYKFIVSRLVIYIIAVILVMSVTGCTANECPLGSTDSTVSSVATKPLDTSPTENKSESTTQTSTETQSAKIMTTEATSAHGEDWTEATREDSPITESAQNTTTPPETEPPTTTMLTEPPSTVPPDTKPSHSHNYQKTDSVAATCTEDGYTIYECSCGSSYTDDYASATGHSWGEWTTTREPTSSAEGEKSRVCSVCGGTETSAIEKLPAEQIDTAALESYGRQYAANTYGYDPIVGTRAGYYPGLTVYIDSME